MADHYEKYKIISKGILYDHGCRFPPVPPSVFKVLTEQVRHLNKLPIMAFRFFNTIPMP